MSATRDTLIETATELFLEKGFTAVGTNEICSSASVNKGTFYHFFPSKTELLVNVIEQYADGFAQAFHDIAKSDLAPEDKLLALFDVPKAANNAWKSNHGFAQGCLIGNMTLELSGANDAVRRTIRKALVDWSDPIESIVDELIQSDVIPEIDRNKAAEVIIGLIQGGLLLAKTMNDPEKVSVFSAGALTHLKSIS